MFKDYYAILEISQSASLTEVKSAYRTQAVKWHPDKNRGVDTTEKMKEINEAKLILSDEEARLRYDKEYLRFKSFKKDKEESNKSEEQEQHEHKKQEQAKKTEEKTRENKEQKPKEEYSTYNFDDDILKKWMENARVQAVRNVEEMIREFRDSSIVGFGTFFKTGFMVIVIGVIFSIIVQILRSI
jgi:curved DNA-binding protein CbpA